MDDVKYLCAICKRIRYHTIFHMDVVKYKGERYSVCLRCRLDKADYFDNNDNMIKYLPLYEIQEECVRVNSESDFEDNTETPDRPKRTSD